MEPTLFARVQHYAAHHDFDTAIFLGEQLLASCTHSRSSALYQNRPHQSSLAQLVADLLPSSFPSSTPAPVPSPLLHSTVLLLAQCYYDSGAAGIPKAYHLLSSTLSAFSGPLHSSPCEPQHRYLLSLSAFHLQRLQEAERFLLPLLSSSAFPLSACAASVLRLLATVCECTSRREQAVDYHRRALAVDPFLWSSVAALAHLGVEVDAADLFTFGADDVRAAEDAGSGKAAEGNAGQPTAPESVPAWHTPAVAPAPDGAQTKERPSVATVTRSLAQSLAAATPSTVPFPLPLSHQNSPLPLTLPSPSPTSASKPKTRSSTTPSSSPPHTRSASTSSPRAINAGVKRITGQQKLAFPTVKERKGKPTAKPMEGHVRTRSVLASGGQGASTVKKKLSDLLDSHAEMDVAMEAGLEVPADDDDKRIDDDAAYDQPTDGAHRRTAPAAERSDDAVQCSAAGVSALLQTLTSAYSALCQYRPTECIRLLSSASAAHAHTPFVLSCLGRAHFELLDYPTSIGFFQRLHDAYPNHLSSLDVYSTALWQCKKDVLLSALSHSLTSLSSLSPITCVVVGNTFSLQRDHDTAVRFFRRAVQLDERYAYAHALCGHELVCMEDYTAALQSYRLAIAHDARQYSAWYGIGNILYQQEKYAQALYHFQHALHINAQSSLLHVVIAMAHVALQQLDSAVSVLHAALALPATAPNPQVYYQLACVHCLRKEWARALEMVERVEEIVWREASVWLLKGRLLRRMGRTEEAMRCLVNAMDLDPKDGNAVKAMMEKMISNKGRRDTHADDDEDDKEVDDDGF